jgi:hypothetical protein
VRVRLVVGFVLVVFLFIVSGCAQQMLCTPPNVVIGNSCCLDANNNSVCDTKEEKEPVKIVKKQPVKQEKTAEETAIEEAAETFAYTWNKKSYTALRNLFVANHRLKFSQQEFNFIARRLDTSLGIQGVSLKSVEDDSVLYEVVLPKKTITVTADIDEEDDEYLHEAFYFFRNMTADAACAGDGECFMKYAVLSKDRNFCSKAGSLKAECVAKFGVSKTVSSKTDDCLEITEYYSRVECLDSLAVAENDIEPCWQATHDKQIFECMGKVAAARDDVDECDPFVASHGYPGTRLQKAYCIVGFVRETSDTKACAKIDRRGDVVLGAMQEGCYKLSFP